MKLVTVLLVLRVAVVLVNDRAKAQGARAKDAADAALNSEPKKPEGAKPLLDSNDSRTAAQLFDDADKYTEKKSAEFEKRHIAFVARLWYKIRQEQHDLPAS